MKPQLVGVVILQQKGGYFKPKKLLTLDRFGYIINMNNNMPYYPHLRPFGILKKKQIKKYI